MRSASAASAVGLGLLAACGTQTPTLGPSDTACSGSMAQLEMGDGYLRNLCGCAEAAGTTASGGSALTCTIPAGTTVFFQFGAARTRHQILATGAPELPSGPEIDPVNPLSPKAHAATLTSAGTYTFRDAFDESVVGSIVVF